MEDLLFFIIKDTSVYRVEYCEYIPFSRMLVLLLRSLVSYCLELNDTTGRRKFEAALKARAPEIMMNELPTRIYMLNTPLLGSNTTYPSTTGEPTLSNICCMRNSCNQHLPRSPISNTRCKKQPYKITPAK